jgi:primosomal protein N' (replication factor Y)
MTHVSLVFPGPWWTPLTYRASRELPEGVRVRAPLGRSLRVGITVKTPPAPFPPDDIEIKEIEEVIDNIPPLPRELWLTAEWFSRMWFVGLGLTLKTLLPSKFFEGAELEPVDFAGAGEDREPQVRCVYAPEDVERRSLYLEMLQKSPDGSLVLFPDHGTAKSFWEEVPEDLKDQGILWPLTGPKKQWEAWKAARSGERRFVVGSQGAATVPMKKLREITVEDESSFVWLTQKHPQYHRRSICAARARHAGANLTLGGRMPSSKVWMRCKDAPEAKEGIEERAVFVNMHDAKGYDSKGIRGRLPISWPLVRESKRALSEGKWVLWMLDRKGYSGEIYCDECGSSVACPNCGGTMRWEEVRGRLYCAACRHETNVPEQCPSCKSRFLEGHRPGTEAIKERAETIFGDSSVVLFEDNAKFETIAKEHPEGALVVGTRKILALADLVEVGAAAWIDADGEARSPEYDSKARAFGMIWESAWRGKNPCARRIIIQSKRPARGWQSAIARGWGNFWEEELRERAVLALPPFVPMVQFNLPQNKKKRFIKAVENAEMDYIESEDNPREVWVRTKQFAQLRAILEPFSRISEARSGIPKATVHHD